MGIEWTNQGSSAAAGGRPPGQNFGYIDRNGMYFDTYLVFCHLHEYTNEYHLLNGFESFMHAAYFIGVSIFLYGLIAGYYVYSAFQNSQKPLHKIRRLVTALVVVFVAVLLGWASLGGLLKSVQVH